MFFNAVARMNHCHWIIAKKSPAELRANWTINPFKISGAPVRGG
jgi:hypothetical protein